MKNHKNHQVVVFMAEWCPHCASMKKYVWTDEKVKQALNEFHNSKPAYIICSKPQNRHLVEEFGIERYPTVVIMDEDHTIKKRANNMDSAELVEFLEDFNG
tara:strand:- start:7779 stop:8081 length:303 start_codon:yes stop_codon:yes gene_type:complete